MGILSGLFSSKRKKIGGSTYTTRKNNVTGKSSKTKSVRAGQYRESTNLATGKRTRTKLW